MLLTSSTRIFGGGVINDYSVSKKVHYFYFVLIIYGLLVFSFYQTLGFALMNNPHNKIRRIGEFADTLLFVGWSFLIVCVYRQFSNQFSYDLTLYLLKLFMVFMIPAFYFWETGKLSVRDVRVMLSLALFSLVLSVSIVFCFDTRSFGRFSDILSIVLLASLLVFIANKAFCFFNDRVLYSKIIVISLIGSLSLAACSLVFEFTNIMALKTDRFIDAGKIFHMGILFRMLAFSGMVLLCQEAGLQQHGQPCPVCFCTGCFNSCFSASTCHWFGSEYF